MSSATRSEEVAAAALSDTARRARRSGPEYDRFLIPTSRGFAIRLNRLRSRNEGVRPQIALLIPGFFCGSVLMDPLAAALRDRGYTVYTLDLRGRTPETMPPDESRVGWTVDDYIRQDFPAALRALRELHPDRRIAVFGHSMGGMIAKFYAGSSHHFRAAGDDDIPDPDEYLDAVITLASPAYMNMRLDFPGFDLLVKSVRMVGVNSAAGMMVDAISGVMGGTFPRLPLGGFLRGVYSVGGDPLRALSFAVSQSFTSMRTWLGYDDISRDEWSHLLENIFCRESIQCLRQFAKSQLSDGVYHSHDERINYTAELENMRVPLCTCLGLRDVIAEPRSVLHAHDVVSSPEKTVFEYETGHGGIVLDSRVVGRIARDTDAWLQR